MLQDAGGQIALTHSVSAGLDYPSIGPEHAALRDAGHAEYVPASDAEALAATTLLVRTEGIIPALESAHAVAEVITRAPMMKKSDVVIVNVSGRGDKDIGILRENLKLDWAAGDTRDYEIFRLRLCTSKAGGTILAQDDNAYSQLWV
jgi:tryptophan synthase beta chain